MPAQTPAIQRRERSRRSGAALTAPCSVRWPAGSPPPPRRRWGRMRPGSGRTRPRRRAAARRPARAPTGPPPAPGCRAGGALGGAGLTPGAVDDVVVLERAPVVALEDAAAVGHANLPDADVGVQHEPRGRR